MNSAAGFGVPHPGLFPSCASCRPCGSVFCLDLLLLPTRSGRGTNSTGPPSHPTAPHPQQGRRLRTRGTNPGLSASSHTGERWGFRIATGRKGSRKGAGVVSHGPRPTPLLGPLLERSGVNGGRSDSTASAYWGGPFAPHKDPIPAVRPRRSCMGPGQEVGPGTTCRAGVVGRQLSARKRGRLMVPPSRKPC